MDSKGRLFVADRSNNRIQIFDQNGKYLDQWTQFSRPGGLFIDRNDMLYVADSESTDREIVWSGPWSILPRGYGYNPGWTRGIRVGSARDGAVTAFIPDPHTPVGSPDDPTSAAEGVAADSAGAIYGAEVGQRDVKKHVPTLANR
jgi:DNA-binding beta-propeller fold protein YncE